MIEQAPCVLIPEYFGSIIFDRCTSKYYPFDHETTDLLKRAKAIPFFVVVNEIPDPAQREQADAFFHHFGDMGFITGDGRFAGEILEIPSAPDHLTGPLTVHLEVTTNCNLACMHCFAGQRLRHGKLLNLKEIEGLVSSMADMGSYRLGLTGGEPLLRRELFDILDLALSHGVHPCVTTNGLLITEQVAREFGKRHGVWLNISLEGATAASNDQMRGTGTFDHVLANLRILAKYTSFTLAFTIMRTNVDEVQACAALAYQVGASTAVFRPLYPVGSAQKHLEALLPTFTQYNQALSALSEMNDGEIDVIDTFSPYSRYQSQAVSHTNYGCGAGNLVCSISASGDVNPCSFLGSTFVAANIRQQSLEAIWHESRVFREIRALPGGTADTFCGGCRARALALNGSINAPDPWMTEKRRMSVPEQPTSKIS